MARTLPDPAVCTRAAIRIADRGYVIVHGRIEFAGDSAAEMNDNELIRQFYLGA